MTRVYVGLALAALYVALVAAAWFKGRDYERDKQISAQLQAAVTIGARQRAGTVREVIRYVDRIRRVEAAVPGVQRDIVARCLGLLPDGSAVRATGDGAPVPADGARDPAAAPARGSRADQAWCQQLADDYARGARNTERVKLCLGWADANGAADP